MAANAACAAYGITAAGANAGDGTPQRPLSRLLRRLRIAAFVGSRGRGRDGMGATLRYDVTGTAPHNGRGFGSFVTYAAAIVGSRGRGRDGFSPAVTLRDAPPFVGTILSASLWIEAVAASWCPRLQIPSRLRFAIAPMPSPPLIAPACHRSAFAPAACVRLRVRSRFLPPSATLTI